MPFNNCPPSPATTVQSSHCCHRGIVFIHLVPLLAEAGPFLYSYSVLSPLRWTCESMGFESCSLQFLCGRRKPDKCRAFFFFFGGEKEDEKQSLESETCCYTPAVAPYWRISQPEWSSSCLLLHCARPACFP